MKKLAILFVFIMLTNLNAFAQCAMCRTTLENNVSNGDPSMAEGINIAILYLLAMPYLAVMVLGYLWYKSRK